MSGRKFLMREWKLEESSTVLSSDERKEQPTHNDIPNENVPQEWRRNLDIVRWG